MVNVEYYYYYYGFDHTFFDDAQLALADDDGRSVENVTGHILFCFDVFHLTAFQTDDRLVGE